MAAGAACDAVFTARYVVTRVRIARGNGDPAAGLDRAEFRGVLPEGWR